MNGDFAMRPFPELRSSTAAVFHLASFSATSGDLYLSFRGQLARR